MKFSAKKTNKNKGDTDIFGTHAVYAALKNPKRVHKKLFITESQANFIQKKNINSIKEVNKLGNKEFYKVFGNEESHQGIVLKTSVLKQPSLEDIIKNSLSKKTDIVVILDQISDPNNIGSIMRSCSLFNCSSIIVSKDNTPDITGSMAKAASGAVEIVNYIKVVNLSRAIIQLKKNNYWVYGLDNNINSISSDNLDLPKKCVIVFGSEGKGLRNLTKKECDKLISIPTKSVKKFDIESLNVSNACSIVLYEHFKNN